MTCKPPLRRRRQLNGGASNRPAHAFWDAEAGRLPLVGIESLALHWHAPKITEWPPRPAPAHS
jgi:hypothetical protein